MQAENPQERQSMHPSPIWTSLLHSGHFLLCKMSCFDIGLCSRGSVDLADSKIGGGAISSSLSGVVAGVDSSMIGVKVSFGTSALLTFPMFRT